VVENEVASIQTSDIFTGQVEHSPSSLSAALSSVDASKYNRSNLVVPSALSDKVSPALNTRHLRFVHIPHSARLTEARVPQAHWVDSYLVQRHFIIHG